MKYLVVPRGEDEIARFSMEVEALDALERIHVPVAPKLRWHAKLLDGAIHVLITEWLEGSSLRDILESGQLGDLDHRIRLLRRITLALQYAVQNMRHRDFHPGNIFILPDDRVRIGPAFDEFRVETGVRIIDWGESTPVIFGNYAEEPDHHFVLLELEGKRIGGSFASLPPEVLDPPSAYDRAGGVYEGWALGLIYVKVLLGRDPPSHASLGDYRKALRTGAIEAWVREAKFDLKALDLPGGDLIPCMVERMMRVEASARMEPSDAKQVLWDVFEEGFELTETDPRMVRYLRDPGNYRPEGGWTYSSFLQDG